MNWSTDEHNTPPKLKGKQPGFKRFFTKEMIATMEKTELFQKHLKPDVLKGEVFPAIRRGEMHFYHKGGCLYKFIGKDLKFEKRHKNYHKYSKGTEGMTCDYEIAKKQCENRYFTGERQLMDKLNRHTFSSERTKIVVLDVEVCLHCKTYGDRKCDLVLLNVEDPNLPKIMFVEGKIFKDSRVNVKVNFAPVVIEQVDRYTMAINEQAVEIVFEYINHIHIINTIFGTNFESPFPASLYNFNVFGFDALVSNHLIPKAKLLVYETPEQLNIHGKHSINMINKELNKEPGENNVMWVAKRTEPTLAEIWEALCK